MSHVPNELSELIPHSVGKLKELAATDPYLAELTARYHELNREIHRAETNIEPTDDMTIEAMKRQRLAILDDLQQAIATIH